MASAREIVITGLGVASPIGIGREPFWASLREGRSGVRSLGWYANRDLPATIAGQVVDLHPERHVRPRKALKVMSWDIQLGVVAADLACIDAGLDSQPVHPERLGVLFGADMIPCDLKEIVAAYRGCMPAGKFDFRLWGKKALAEMFPLWMLKYLPNMAACHVGIARDARGPNNSLTLGEVSSLAAIAEAKRVIERGQADAMIAGGTGCRIHPVIWSRHEVYHPSQRRDDPTRASRPFDAERDGMVHGEGAGAFVLEERSHAEARGAKVLARILGQASAFEPRGRDKPLEGRAIRASIRGALRDAGLEPRDVGHVNAHGLSTKIDDELEAQAIHDTLGDVPVTAPKSFFGNLAAGGGAVEMAVSVLALEKGLVPPTLNYEHPDPNCPVNVIHGKPMEVSQPTALVLNHSRVGHSVALILGASEA
ncbi:MAG TPA: beta-ketoacyl-[acyl-carrier-protein] synthase family protein [Thermoguttaceae bacterium]|nr:beta-ketoacyl-[acyl-carrier-protein] synthase family protein [Thermoguttaceae bacterium]